MDTKKKKQQHGKRNKNKKSKKDKLLHDATVDEPKVGTITDSELNQNNESDVDDSREQSLKRPYDENNSDIDEQPMKKPKQKLKTESDKKGKKSIRQMKREKHAQRQAEAEAASKAVHKSHCLSYLQQWKHNKQNWKFMKIKQVWLCKNMFSSDLVPNEYWAMLLEYFESAHGGVRQLLLDKAQKVITQMDEWTESQNKESSKEISDDAPEVVKPDVTVYKRARDLIQCLQ